MVVIRDKIERIDVALKDYYASNARFADLINAVCYQGRLVLSANDLVNAETGQVQVINGQGSDVIEIVNTRDVARYARSPKTGSLYAVFGCENQTAISYSMPVRVMGYDFANYAMQLRQIADKHKEKEDLKASEEFLSGCTKDDRLMPVYTIVLYYGSKPWDGPTDLKDMLRQDGPAPLPLPSYPIRVVEVGASGLKLHNVDNQALFAMCATNRQIALAGTGRKKGAERLIETVEQYVDKAPDAVHAFAALSGSAEIINLADEAKKGNNTMKNALDLYVEEQTHEWKERAENSNKRVEELKKSYDELKQRAEKSEQRAEKSEQRAEKSEQRVQELEAELARLRQAQA